MRRVLKGLKAPYDEEHTEDIFKIEFVPAGESLVSFWFLKSNQDHFSGKQIEDLNLNNLRAMTCSNGSRVQLTRTQDSRMAHDLATTTEGKVSIMSTGETPWHGLGTKLDQPASSQEAIEAAGLNYRVDLKPIYTGDGP